MELSLAPKAMPSITGNFNDYKKNLIKTIEGYKGMPLTEETVAPIKSAIRQIRTSLEKMESTAVSAYFDTPKKMLKAEFAELYSIIAEGEGKVDAIIAEDTRRRNEEVTERLVKYITSKVGSMALEKDVVDYVVLRKSYFNKTAKEVETLNEIDAELLQLEKNFASFIRAEKKINKLAQEIGATFNKGRFLYALSKYGDGNDSVAAQAEEEADRLAQAAKEPAPVKAQARMPEVEESITILLDFPVVDKKKSKGSDDVTLSFSVPKEAKKNFAELLQQLKAVGIKSKKV